MSDIVNFMVMTRTSGQDVYYHSADSREYLHLAYASRLAVDLLKTPNGRQSLSSLAMEYDSQYHHTQLFQGDHRIARYYIEMFIDKISLTFPAVVIDQAMTSPDNLGCYVRGSWTGDYRAFNPRTQMLHLNASKVYNMLQAPQDQSTVADFRKYQFLLAATMARGIGGHLLINFLSKGEELAVEPTKIAAQGYFNPQRRSGEPGQMFELRLFGGNVQAYRDNKYNIHDVGTCHLVDARGRRFMIHEKFFEEFFTRRFTLPLRLSGEIKAPTRCTAYGIPFANSDLSVQPMTVERDHNRRMQQYLRGFNIRLRDVYRLGRDPRLMPTGHI